MLFTPLIIALIVFIVLIVADAVSYLLSSGLLFMFYMFSLVTFELSILQKIFYPLGILFFLAVRANMGARLHTNSDSVRLDGFAAQSLGTRVLSGLKYHAFSIIIGIVMLFVMFMISAQKGQILGVAQLSAVGGTFSTLTLLFAPAISLSIGFIENRLFFTFLAMLREGGSVFDALTGLLTSIAIPIPILGQLLTLAMTAIAFVIKFFATAMPSVLTALMFGLFHIQAYAIQWKLMLWAASIFFMWIISYKLTGDDLTAADTAHGGWNGWVTVNDLQSFSIF